jgi:3-oxoacyl-[acyl-carrier-protein] synthase II
MARTLLGAPAYILGVGAVTPLGCTWADSLDALAAGRSAIAPIRSFDASGYPSTVAATVDFPLACASPDRRLALLRPALHQALTAAELDLRTIEPRRIGVFIGAESGRAPLATVLSLCQAAGDPAASSATFDHIRFGHAAAQLARTQPAFSLLMSPAAVAQSIAAEHGAAGPVQTFSLACASSAAAIAEAVRALRLGRCQVALCGGVGADVDPLMLAGFGKLGALSLRGESCPFDVRRDGFVVGEGAAALVLSSQPPAGADKIALVGIGRSLDAYHLTAPDPDGAGAERAMRAALADAGQATVDHVQAHGTSTPLNDAIEALALRRVLGASLDGAAVSSVKGALGHWVAGAGALGLLCAYEAVRSGTVLPTAGLAQPDPRCDLPHVLGQAARRRVDRALVNAFAFGGANCSLLVARCA